MKSSQVGQAWSPLHESMLATPNHLVFEMISERLKWGWVACCSLNAPSWRQRWHLLSFSSQKSYSSVQPFTNNRGRTRQYLLAVSHQVPGICVSPGCLDVPLPGPPPARATLPCYRLFLRSQGPGIPVTKTYQWTSRWRRHWEPDYLPCVLSGGPLKHFCNRCTFSMIFLFVLNWVFLFMLNCL